MKQQQQVLVSVFFIIALLTVSKAQDNPLGFIDDLLGNFNMSTLEDDLKELGAEYGQNNAVQPCGEGMAACASGSVCHATPLGNFCIDARLVPCRQTSECRSNAQCFMPNGAQVGYCGGCDTEVDCASATSKASQCAKAGFMKYGICVQCYMDENCQEGYFCHHDNEGYEDMIQEHSGMLSAFTGGMPPPPPPQRRKRQLESRGMIASFTCMAKFPSGSSCVRKAECQSNKCIKRKIFFFITSKTGKCQ